ncbi:alpha/beta fold hydrolase [Rhodoferax antarcticus]|uniref:Alpha/beta hydrolase fold family protein n=1 Tax=Rhodoferax antarcticus ANT.BR TaxID=1111071 RepID=A0A1Q8YA52_9BURK|nr:alpha/beta hydrolase [Rhodoferax antarcticus]APW47059.1 alpha/beta hydrolase [Rhodoferax antarcticus]OLP04931.1 alpha/beta hydrolase fold family protein [Rhodoferax antarcticus ANT.BR]
MYRIQKVSRSVLIPIRGLQYYARVWGEPLLGQPPLVLLHGWMDVAASFQFVVDALQADHYVIAPDWRGFGLSASGGADSFWYPDYLADLDALLDHFSPDAPVNLVGHSMGGNIAMLYTGVRPERVLRLINLEGFGLPATQADEAPGRLTRWLGEVKQHNSGTLSLKTYPSLEAVARRLMKNNPYVSEDKAHWLANHWSAELSPGQWSILGEAAHKVINPQLYRVDEVLAIYRCIRAPVLMVEASDESMTQWWRGSFTLAEHRQRMQQVAKLEIVTLPDCGHMLHHDQPEALAGLIERFIAQVAGT